MSMYIRLKRKNQTIFMHVEPSNSFAQIKQRIGETLSIDPTHITLYAFDKKKELVDAATISDQEIVSDDVVYMTFLKENGSGWEELQVDTLVPVANDS